MGHNLEVINNKASMFWVSDDDTPWHGLGTEVKQALTAEEALMEAKLNFEVKQTDSVFSNGYENKIVPDRKVNYRSDNGEYLGTVGNRYSVLQNRDAFAFFDELVKEDEAMYHTAGVLGKGKVIWIMAKLPDYIVGADGKRIDKYIVISNSHNGSRALNATITPIRVVCNNTLNAALSNAINKITIRHSGDIKQKLREAHKLMDISRDYFKEFPLVMNRLHDVSVTEEELSRFVTKMFPKNPLVKNQARVENLRKECTNTIFNHIGQDIDHSLYWLYNGIIAYSDNGKSYTQQSTRLKNAWFNPLFKDKAFTEISSMFQHKTGYELSNKAIEV